MSEKVVEYICTLDQKISCPKREPEGKCLDIDGKCGFMQKTIDEGVHETKEYIRKERWFEQYYN